ncbi:uncharacterized protein LOC114883142 isoform X1 [Osmia bicornis bicornis]|uniref:uncharacterized protein LOC114883142 isoform X1 n=1 Tax=Osmia bicornis bicornis TaxID=1437191 RepID=UPI001EAEBEC0|nr:uncharacterized protein LOC114883142 isoform X1 [Osmia bicornis bicornis]XP_029056462.2 uncharacterized protein LOC114883142 isoform X1 [Osmia bicornis bicornis]XP_046143004.1 uncharacterized protein LOC114883142 isoform X1 [Osmia bicornis bicornis]
MSRCKCPIPEDDPCSVCFEDITSKMQERRCDLLGRQKYLRDKITTMERSIPALIAYNMWTCKKCEDAPYCKIREIMRRFSPYPDQTERLLDNLKRTVKELNGETAELHEKIIQADVKLEETDMELDSLELVNKEMNDALNDLQKEVRSYKCPSLHSIRSEDIICLSKIRQLAEEELSLKNCIKELEQRETIFKEQMDRLLTSREYQNVCGRRKINCAQDLECNGMKICCVPKKCLMRSSNDFRPKKKQAQRKSDAVVSTSEQNINEKPEQEIKQEKSGDQVEKKSSWMPNWWKNNENKAEEVSSQTKSVTSSNPENNKNEESIGATPSNSEKKGEKAINDKPSKQSKSKFSTPSCEPCGHMTCPPGTSTKLPHRSRPCIGPREIQSMMKKSCTGRISFCNQSFPRSSPSRKGCCELSSCPIMDHGIRKMCKPILVPPCDLRSPCEICPSPCNGFLHPKGNCRCNCKGKCALGLSDAECNCSDALNDYHPTGSQYLNEDSNSEDEFCECCSCGCEDSDASLSCQCN